MGMETLNNAARAAGYAMASSDELLDEGPRARNPETAWRSREAVVRQGRKGSIAAHSVGDRIKGFFSLFGRSAPA